MRIRVLLTLCLVAAGLVLALPVSAEPAAPDAVTLPPIADETANIFDLELNLDTILVARGSSATGATCISQFESFLKFDLSAVPANYTITSATLNLTAAGTFGTNPTLTMGLFGSNTDGWSEGGTELQWDSRPQDLTNLNSTHGIEPTTGAPVVFASSSEFVDFLNQQNSGDDIATLAIQLTACSSPYAGQALGSRECATPPSLTITAQGPNAVTLTDVSAQSTALPLYGVLGLLAMVTVGGIVISRRRTAAR